MTSKQVMLTLALLLWSCGCTFISKQGADPLISPYTERRVWAVAPLRNESGSRLVGWRAAMADHFAHQLENASNIDVLPVNRVLAAMDSLQMREPHTPADAMKLLETLQVDGLIVGTITAYDAYDPPKIGLAVELYTSRRIERSEEADPRRLSSEAVDSDTPPRRTKDVSEREPVSIVSGFFDAADPDVRHELDRYATHRRVQKDPSFVFESDQAEPERMYRISMDLYCEFASYVTSWRLLKEERERLAPPPTDQDRPLGRRIVSATRWAGSTGTNVPDSNSSNPLLSSEPPEPSDPPRQAATGFRRRCPATTPPARCVSWFSSRTGSGTSSATPPARRTSCSRAWRIWPVIPSRS